MRINGTCHCGNIIFALDWEPFPRRDSGARLRLLVLHQARRRVDFGAGRRAENHSAGARARFALCIRHAHCRVPRLLRVAVCMPVVTSEIEGHLYAVVNVNTFDGVDPALLQRWPANFDGEGTDSRLARGARNWIGNVQFIERS